MADSDIPEYGSGFAHPNSDHRGDYSDTKPGLGRVFPDNEVEATFEFHEPLIGPEKLKDLHLFGIPLVSAVPDPITGKPDVLTPPKIQGHIIEAVALAEFESGLDIFPHQYEEKLPFDKAEYDSFGYMMLRHRPVSSLEHLSVVMSDQTEIYDIPPAWTDIGQLHTGQLNLIPLTIAMKSGTVVPLTTSAGGATFLSIFGNRPWLPSFFQCTYTTGFPKSQIPKVVNQLIGCVAAMEILSLLATTYSRSTSSSLSFDGISQSVSTPGPEIFTQRLKELGEKRRFLIKKLQRFYGVGILLGNV
jgi:hypothetical protein